MLASIFDTISQFLEYFDRHKMGFLDRFRRRRSGVEEKRCDSAVHGTYVDRLRSIRQRNRHFSDFFS